MAKARNECLFCAARLPLFLRLKGSDFCSDEHRAAYYQQQQQLALERLIETDRILNRAKGAKLAAKHSQFSIEGGSGPPSRPRLSEPTGGLACPIAASSPGALLPHPITAPAAEPVPFEHGLAFPWAELRVMDAFPAAPVSEQGPESDPAAAVSDLLHLALAPEGFNRISSPPKPDFARPSEASSRASEPLDCALVVALPSRRGLDEGSEGPVLALGEPESTREAPAPSRPSMRASAPDLRTEPFANRPAFPRFQPHVELEYSAVLRPAERRKLPIPDRRREPSLSRAFGPLLPPVESAFPVGGYCPDRPDFAAAAGNPERTELAGALPLGFEPGRIALAPIAAGTTATPELRQPKPFPPSAPDRPRRVQPPMAGQIAPAGWKPFAREPDEAEAAGASFALLTIRIPIAPPDGRFRPERIDLLRCDERKPPLGEPVPHAPDRLRATRPSSASDASPSFAPSVPPEAPKFMLGPDLPHSPRPQQTPAPSDSYTPRPLDYGRSARSTNGAEPLNGRPPRALPDYRLDIDGTSPVRPGDMPRRPETLHERNLITSPPPPLPLRSTMRRIASDSVGPFGWLRRRPATAALGALILAGLVWLGLSARRIERGTSTGVLDGMRAELSRRAGVKLTEKFVSRFDKWKGRTDLEKTWHVDEQGLIAPGELAIYAPSARMDDYTMTFAGKIEKRAMGWAFRIKDLGNYQAAKLVVVKPGPLPSLALERYTVLDGRETPHRTIPISLTMRGQSIFKVMVDARGPDFVVKVENRIADAWTDVRITSGGVGFFAMKGESSRIIQMDLEYHYDLIGRVCALFTTPSVLSSGVR